ncbi:MAG: hypothetical protein L7W43_16410, partial [Rubripirellula sp.]|nr:hypothetical protein [Rubripirellula sp.]
MSSATQGNSPPVTTTSQSEHGGGGVWKQVRFEELSDKPIGEPCAEEPTTTTLPATTPHPKIRLTR